MTDYDGPERREYNDHSCKHEVDLALIAQNIEVILKNQTDIKSIIFGGIIPRRPTAKQTGPFM